MFDFTSYIWLCYLLRQVYNKMPGEHNYLDNHIVIVHKHRQCLCLQCLCGAADPIQSSRASKLDTWYTAPRTDWVQISTLTGNLIRLYYIQIIGAECTRICYITWNRYVTWNRFVTWSSSLVILNDGALCCSRLWQDISSCILAFIISK